MSKAPVALVPALLSMAASLSAQVRVRPHPLRRSQPQNWLTYSGTMQSQRHSSLAQITAGDVRRLRFPPRPH